MTNTSMNQDYIIIHIDHTVRIIHITRIDHITHIILVTNFKQHAFMKCAAYFLCHLVYW